MEDPEHVLFITYEELQQDPNQVCARICAFAGIEADEAERVKAVAASSFGAMKANKNVTDGGMVGRVRQGVMGAWTKQWTVQQSKLFDELYERRMQDSGLEMHFG